MENWIENQKHGHWENLCVCFRVKKSKFEGNVREILRGPEYFENDCVVRSDLMFTPNSLKKIDRTVVIEISSSLRTFKVFWNEEIVQKKHKN